MLLNDKGRTRILTIRLAADEYERLKDACIAERARSVSEYSRTAIMRRVTARTQKAKIIGEDLASLGLRLSELDAELRQLSLSIGKLVGDGLSIDDGLSIGESLNIGDGLSIGDGLRNGSTAS